MNERVRHKLAEIIQRYGRDLCGQPKRCKGLLLDHCAGDRLEVFVLVSALEEQVAADLVSGLGSQSWGLVSSRLVRRLVEHRAMAEDAAVWAVESWALALGLISEAELAAGRPARQGRETKRPPATNQPRSPGNPRSSASGQQQVSAPDVITTGTGEIRLKRIPTGEFWMGSLDNDPEACDDEKPHHKVRISRAFYLGVMPVTQAQYEAVLGKKPSHFKGRLEHPVENVTWFGAAEFCNELSRKERLRPYYEIWFSKVLIAGGTGYRLPAEAEWEYACRAGSNTRYSFGENAACLGNNAWYSANSQGQTWPVGRKHPNAFGLHDMHGNVWEWCWDGYDRFYYRQSPDLDPPGKEWEIQYRVVRGGSWNDLASDVRAASRHAFWPQFEFPFLGFRIARDVPNP